MEATNLPPWGMLENKAQDQAGLGRLGFLLRIFARRCLEGCPVSTHP